MAGANGSSRWTDALLDRMRELGDPVADRPVAAVLERGGVDAVNAIMRTLVRDRPAGAGRVARTRSRTTWSRPCPCPSGSTCARSSAAQQLFETYGLRIACLPVLRIAPVVVRGSQGRAGAVPDRPARYRRTPAGDGDRPVPDRRGRTSAASTKHGKGRRAIQHVRLMHAAVRHLIKARNELTARPVASRLGHTDQPGGPRRDAPVVLICRRRIRCVALACECPPRTSTRTCICGTSSGTCSVCATSCSCATSATPPRWSTPSGAGSSRRRPKGRSMTGALLDLLDELTPVAPVRRHGPAVDPPSDRRRYRRPAARAEVGSRRRPRAGSRASPSGSSCTSSAGSSVTLPRYQLVSRMVRPFGRDLLTRVFRLERGGERAPFDIPDHLARSWELSA